MLLVTVCGGNRSLRAHGFALKNLYAQCGLSSYEIDRKLQQWNKVFGPSFDRYNFQNNFKDNFIETAQLFLPCTWCQDCLQEIQEHPFFKQEFIQEEWPLRQFVKACKTFLFQLVKKSCARHMVNRCKSSNEKSKINLLEDSYIQIYVDEERRQKQEQRLAEKAQQEWQDFRTHTAQFRASLKAMSFERDCRKLEKRYDQDCAEWDLYDKQYQEDSAKFEEDEREYISMMNENYKTITESLIAIYFSSRNPDALDSHSLVYVFYLLDSVEYFKWLKIKCTFYFNKFEEDDEIGEESDDSKDYDDNDSWTSDDFFWHDKAHHLDEFLAWCKWVKDNVNSIRASVEETNFENAALQDYNDSLSSEDDYQSECKDTQVLEESSDDEDFVIDPKSLGQRKYKHQRL